MVRTDQTFHYKQPFELELGGQLPGFQLKYTLFGKLNADRSNVIWVCHALTGNSDFTSWWGDLFKEGSVFDPRNYFIVCANSLGGCYGSTGPLSINPQTGKPYYHSFPTITNRDIVNAFDLLRESLRFEKIHTLIGGSLGGQHVLEWAIQKQYVFDHVIPIACNAFHSPWGIAFNEAQRMAIQADVSWKENHDRAGLEGLKAARALAMLSYRTYESYKLTQSEKNTEVFQRFRAATYQQYQGDKLAHRFNAFSYWVLTHAMDSHHVARGRRSLALALQTIRAKTLVVGIDSDGLFPLAEQEFLADHIPQGTLQIIQSKFGHDAFLIEFDQLNALLKEFLSKEKETVFL